MTILKKDLKPTANNNLNSYFPIRTSNSGDAYDWEYAKSIVIRNLYMRTLSKSMLRTLAKSKNKSDQEIVNYKGGDNAAINYLSEYTKSQFMDVLDEEELWPIVEDMYLKEDTFFKLAPESSLFYLASYSKSSSKNRLADLFTSLMSGLYLKRNGKAKDHETSNPNESQDELKRVERNFLEQNPAKEKTTDDQCRLSLG